MSIVTQPNQGEATLRDDAALTSSYVASDMISVRTADFVDFMLYIDDDGSINQADAQIQYSTKADPDEDTDDDWATLKSESVSSGVVTQYDKTWTWTSLADGVYPIRTDAMGDWMRVKVKANAAGGSCEIGVKTRK